MLGDAAHAVGRPARPRRRRRGRLHAHDRGARAAAARGLRRGERRLDRPGRVARRASRPPHCEAVDRARRGVHGRSDARRARCSRRSSGSARARWETEVSAALAHPPAARRGGRARPRPPARRRWINGQYRWVADRDVARRARPSALDDRGRAGRAPAALARRLRPGDRDRHPLVDGLDGPRGAGGARVRTARRRRARTARRASCSPTTSSRRRRPRPWAALLPTLDPTTMGWKERDWYLGAARARPLRLATATPGRPSGGTAGSSAAGRSAGTARSSSAARGRRRRRGARDRGRGRAPREPGSATCASRRASCRRSSGLASRA